MSIRELENGDLQISMPADGDRRIYSSIILRSDTVDELAGILAKRAKNIEHCDCCSIGG